MVANLASDQNATWCRHDISNQDKHFLLHLTCQFWEFALQDVHGSLSGSLSLCMSLEVQRYILYSLVYCGKPHFREFKLAFLMLM